VVEAAMTFANEVMVSELVVEVGGVILQGVGIGIGVAGVVGRREGMHECCRAAFALRSMADNLLLHHFLSNSTSD